MTQGMNLMCVSHKHGLLSEPSVKWYIFYSEPQWIPSLPRALSFSFLLPPSLHCEPKNSPPSHDDNGSIKGFFTETMATPCVDTLADDQLDLGFGGWDHVILALTTLPQHHLGGLAPRIPLPRPITPNHCEW